MKQVLLRSSLALVAAVCCGPSGASLAYKYDFFTLSVTCSVPPDIPGDESLCAEGEGFVRGGMDRVTAVLNEEAVRRGTARLEVEVVATYPPPIGSKVVLNEGFLAATAFNGHNLLDSAALQVGRIDIGLDPLVPDFLRGGYFYGGVFDSFNMSSGGNLWSGEFSSDGIPWTGHFPELFTGEWRLVEVLNVAEPSTAVLCLAMLGALVAVRRRPLSA